MTDAELNALRDYAVTFPAHIILEYLDMWAEVCKKHPLNETREQMRALVLVALVEGVDAKTAKTWALALAT